MDAQRKLISLAKDRGGFESYSALAKRVGVTTATMSQWRSGTAPLSEERLEEFAEIAGENAGFWDIAIRSERAKSASLRRQLQAFLKAGAVLALAVAIAPQTLGETPNFPTDGSCRSIHYAKCAHALRRIVRRLASSLAHLIRGESDVAPTVLA